MTSDSRNVARGPSCTVAVDNNLEKGGMVEMSSFSEESAMLNGKWKNTALDMTQNVGIKRKVRLSNEGKRAAHVKFDGKTIALGTFPDEDADVICSRAKLLTKTWRDMYPKPSVEWVKRSLEKSGIRVVNDRPGRQPGPGRYSKRERGPNAKLLPSFAPFAGEEGAGMSVMREIQAGSQLSCITIPSPNTARSKIKSYTNPFTSTAEGESVSTCEIQPSSLLFSSGNSPHSVAKTTLPQDLQNETNDHDKDRDIENYAIRRNYGRGTDTEVKDSDKHLQARSEVERRLTLEDLGDRDIESTYAMLQRHHSNLINEIEETSALMDAYRKERDRRQARKQLQKGSEPVI